MRFAQSVLVALCATAALAGTADAARPQPPLLFSVGYANGADLQRAIANRADVILRIGRLHVAEVRSRVPGFAAAALSVAGIRYVQPVRLRPARSEPALAVMQPGLSVPYEWEFAATHEDAVPAPVLRAAANVTIAVLDTGADLTAPDLAAKHPASYDLFGRTADVRDVNGHGTFVSSLAAGSVTNGEGIAGFGGDAKLLVVKTARPDGTLTDVDETNGIMYAVAHGARVINLSVGGPSTSVTERLGIAYAAAHGVLVVAAAGNEYLHGNPVEYPAALLQPVGSDGVGGVGLSVGASALDGTRAFFSNTGSQISLAAPGENVFADVSSLASPVLYPRSALPGSAAGAYGFASGTSFASPEVAGIAALVFAANPFLTPPDVAEILKASASGHGRWNPATGYGVVDAGAAVALAQSRAGVRVMAARAPHRVRLTWTASAPGPFRVSERTGTGPVKVVLPSTLRTTASFPVRRRHRYLFTVDLLQADGTVAATSSVSVRG
jgi:serine protease